MEDQNKNHDELQRKFSHIKGWGVDADPQDHPNYPYKNWTGDDHKRLNWDRPPRQEKTVEILESTEHERTPAAFGTVAPPKGVSGAMRRGAFKYSENMLRHWLMLLMADRVDAVEGVVSDLGKAKVPNLIKERGMDALWEHNKPLLMRRVLVRAAIYGAVIGLLAYALSDDEKREVKPV